MGICNPAAATLVADLKNDYLAGASAGDQAANLPAAGTGQWNYYSQDEEAPASITLLEWDTAGGNYENTTDSHTDGHGGAFDSWPLVGLTTTFGGTLSANELFVHPGHDDGTFVPSGEEFLLLRWTAGTGETGAINLSGAIRRLNSDSGPSNDGIGLEILVNGASVFTAPVPTTTSVPFNINSTIVAGQNVDFVVDHGPAELLFSDSGALSAVIELQAIPEPSTFALATLGLLSLGLVAWRRRRRA
ncbi:MAG: PEP-CTERM sorting domain-containing protein [Verrucomicrobia bacterium]|nr:PEP-CTERM sorting domain-containing protein [Verrucomicrobiota bacterium]